MISIIFSISNLLCRYDQRSRLSSVSVIPDHDLFSIRDPWSWWQSLIMLIFSITIILSGYDIISSINNHWSWLSLVSVVISLKISMIRDHDYLQYQWSLIMISSVSGIPDHGGNPWSCLSSVDWIIPSTIFKFLINYFGRLQFFSHKLATDTIYCDCFLLFLYEFEICYEIGWMLLYGTTVDGFLDLS
jgi:hypothetical protein